MPDVSTSRGACGERADDCQNAGPGKYASSPDRGVEDDVRHAAVSPLGAEERTELLLGLRLVVPRPAEGHERRVPAPLVRVEGPGRQRRPADPVRVEHLARAVLQAGQDVAGGRRHEAGSGRPPAPGTSSAAAGAGGAASSAWYSARSSRSSACSGTEEHDRRADQHGDDAGRVGPVGRRRGTTSLAPAVIAVGVLRVLRPRPAPRSRTTWSAAPGRCW